MANPRGALAHVSKTGRRANAPKVPADKSAGANGPTPKESGRVASAQVVDTVSEGTGAGDNVEFTEHGKANGATAESVATAGRADADNPRNRSPPTAERKDVLFSPVPTDSEPNAATPLALAKEGLCPEAAKNDDEKEEKKTVNANELEKQTFTRFKPNVKLMKLLKSLPQKYKEYLEHVHTDAQSAEFLSQISLKELAAFMYGAHKQADKNSKIAQRLLLKCKEHMLRLMELSQGGRTDHEEVEALEVTEAERDKYIARFTYFRKLMLAGVVAYRLLEEVGSLKARTEELEKELKRANDTAEADWLRLAADKSELEQERQGLEQANAQLTTTSRRFKLAAATAIGLLVVGLLIAMCGFATSSSPDGRYVLDSLQANKLKDPGMAGGSDVNFTIILSVDAPPSSLKLLSLSASEQAAKEEAQHEELERLYVAAKDDYSLDSLAAAYGTALKEHQATEASREGGLSAAHTAAHEYLAGLVASEQSRIRKAGGDERVDSAFLAKLEAAMEEHETKFDQAPIKFPVSAEAMEKIISTKVEVIALTNALDACVNIAGRVCFLGLKDAFTFSAAVEMTYTHEASDVEEHEADHQAIVELIDAALASLDAKPAGAVIKSALVAHYVAFDRFEAVVSV